MLEVRDQGRNMSDGIIVVSYSDVASIELLEKKVAEFLITCPRLSISVEGDFVWRSKIKLDIKSCEDCESSTEGVSVYKNRRERVSCNEGSHDRADLILDLLIGLIEATVYLSSRKRWVRIASLQDLDVWDPVLEVEPVGTSEGEHDFIIFAIPSGICECVSPHVMDSIDILKSTIVCARSTTLPKIERLILAVGCSRVIDTLLADGRTVEVRGSECHGG